MQGQRSAWGSFNDTVDLNQESLSSNTSMDHPTAWNNLLNPVDSRLSHNARSFSGWDLGESSSSANLRDPISGDGLKMEHGWPSSYSACSLTETQLEEQRLESSNNLFHDPVTNGLGGSQVMWGPPVNVNLNDRYAGNDEGGLGIGTGIFPSFYKSGGLDSEQVPSSSDVGTSSGNSGCFMESDDGSGSSLGNWGLSCKRKALEGTSAQPYPSGNINFFPQADNIISHTTPARHNSSRSLNLSSPAVDSPAVIRLEQPNPRLGHSMRGVTSDVFPPLNVTAPAEESTRNFGPRVNLNIGHPESVPFNLPSAGNAVRHSSSRSSHQSSRSVSFSDSFEFGPTASIPSNSSNRPSSLPHLMHGPGPGPSLTRNVPFHWNGALNSRTASSSSVGLREESSFRSTMRNNLEHPMFGPVSETRNLVQDPTNWSLATGSSTNSSSRAGPSSSSRNFPTAWLPHHNQPTQNHQPRLSDFAPWTLFPSGESGAGGSRGHFSPFASGPTSSPEETVMSSGGNNSQGHRQPYSRSAALLMELQGDDISGWRSLAADIDGRQRLVSEIRHVLNAMRRGENLRAEDYMLFDPFINGVAELHDRHRDMRLDVDNMSYEELLALEEQIGDVNTGLSEETILKSMKQRKYLTFMVRAHPSKIEPCCICQEEYVSGETIGTLDCGHDFHTNCVKQWLLQKNLCPICKMTALDT